MNRTTTLLVAIILAVSCATSTTTLIASHRIQHELDQAHSQLREVKAGRQVARDTAAWWRHTSQLAYRSARVRAGELAQLRRRVSDLRASRSEARVPLPAAPAGRWDAIAACESGGDPAKNTGNGYYGLLQEDMGFWTTYDGLDFAARPDLATASEQIVVAARARDGYTNKAGRTFAARGYTPWPVCGR